MTERWIDIAIGAWLIIAPWALGFSGSFFAKWGSVLCGIVLVLLNARALSLKWKNEEKIPLT